MGTGGTIWPESLQANQSTYRPPWIATSEPSLETSVLGSSISPKYLRNVLTSSPVPSNYQIWHTPAVQQCDRIVRKAYPTTQDHSTHEPAHRFGPELLRRGIGVPQPRPVRDDRQGGREEPHLVQLRPRRVRAEGRGHPRGGRTRFFRPGRAYAIGPVYLVTYDTADNELEFSDSPVTK